MEAVAAHEVGQRLRAAKSICIFGRQHIGDVVNETPAIAAIRRNCPQARLGVTVGERTADVLANSPDFDLLIPRPWKRDFVSKARYIWNLRKHRFEAAILLDEVGSQGRNAAAAGIGLVAGIVLPGAPPLAASVLFDPEAHDGRGQAPRLLDALGFEFGDDRPRLFPSEKDEAQAEGIVKSIGHPIVIVHPGASEAKRRWPAERFAETIRLLKNEGLGVAVTGSAGERELCEQVALISGAHPAVHAGDLGVLAFAALAAKAKAVLVGDTGPMHIAAAMGTRTVALFGPSYPHLTGPYGDGSRFLQAECDCALRSWRTCTFSCMEAISVSEVVSAVLEAACA